MPKGPTVNRICRRCGLRGISKSNESGICGVCSSEIYRDNLDSQWFNEIKKPIVLKKGLARA